MTTRRIKMTKPAINTIEEADAVLAEVAQLTLDADEIRLAMNRAITEIREAHSARIDDIEARLKDKAALLEAWAGDHPEAFGKRKSLELTSGTIGFRTGTHKFKQLAGWSLDRIKAALLATPWGAAYVRVKEEVDKARLISDAVSGNLTAEQIRTIGGRIDQEESFFVDPKLEQRPAA
jgi:phage host-nuclease inhibitor protein Gam